VTPKQITSAAQSAIESARVAWGPGWNRIGDKSRRAELAFYVLTDAAAFAPNMTAAEIDTVFREACKTCGC
jgi:hypothetical protein